MPDVTCKAVQLFLDVAKARGVGLAELTDGLGYAPEFFRDKDNRISWEHFAEIGVRLRRLCELNDDDLVDIGRGVFKSGGLRFVMPLARIFGDPVKFYRWMHRGNKMLFANMVSEVEEIDERSLRIKVRLREQDPVSMEYLLVSKGGISSMPTLFGYPAAQVEFEVVETGADFLVTLGQRRRSAFRRLFDALRGTHETAEELLATNLALSQRIEQITAANAQIRLQSELVDRQAARLQLAHEVSKMIHGRFDVQATLQRVADSLLAHTQASRVEIALTDGEVRAEAVRGTPPAGGTVGDAPPRLPPGAEAQSAPGADQASGASRSGVSRVVLPVEIRGQEMASLALWGTGTVELEATLSYVLPVVAMALDNALKFRELSEYQQNLERLVEERTADLRAARDDLATTVVQLREVQGSRDAFFANISHEIRTPLALIVLAAGDVEQALGLALEPRVRGNLISITAGARKLLRLVDELLLLAAGEETKLRLRYEVVDVGQMVATLVATWRPAAETAGHTLELHAPASSRAFLDEVALDRIVTNLVSNAIRYTPRGGRISVVLAERDDELEIRVRDTGIGISDELAPRLFGRFERGHDNNGKGGSGIGLSLVKQLCESHGGTVSFERPAAGGSEFVVKLPRRLAEASGHAPAGGRDARRLEPVDFAVPVVDLRPLEPSRPAGPSAGTVLVAEDDPELLKMVVRLLSDEYAVIPAADGATALELAKKHLPHLLVTDVQMPGMSGIELAERFRAISEDRLAPVVIMSALGDLGTRLRGLDAGAVDYVVKPFDPKELRARVRAQFRMRDLAMRLHQAEQLSALGTLSAGLAHELRNPANGIINAIAPLRRQLPAALVAKDQPAGQLLDVVASCADQIAFLSRQLLSFRSKGELELRTSTVAELVRKSLTLAHGGMSGVEVRLALDFEGQIQCAPQLMVQVLTNLLDNAAQAANGGWVEVASRAGEHTVSIEVCDSGKGVPTELRERVFEPFFTTKPPGVGTGLGLPLARDIVHRHGGTLEIRDRGNHSVFAIELPRQPAS